ncbi:MULTISPECIES: GntP family permease [Corynebacterium]|uniref:GntP family permease n=1 Tax=Corynebacterium lipophilum TaxID=2804918 RepID=A0AAW5HZF7_9CORY|nr:MULTISPECIES: GntP family permease [Corynebacterium]MCO6395240.1 GntP family permease [Corynebacterium lipophilum]MCQ4608533.1 GntP family permease [Corynebacterium pseudogenitalium]MCQ4617023.1 GntP family permease [Corynebacterium pseudogenitalium]MCZ2117991.1 GntP family permease [Corynebacterium lipophilum]MDK8244277.1 GntP family permease [Corynebacterium sp. UMB10321]
METWEQTLSAGPLMGIAAVGIALILLLIIQFRVHAFVTLILVSVLTAIAAGIPTGELYDVVMGGFRSTLGDVGILVGLGAMLGKLIEYSGGARVLANTMIDRFGERRAPMALGVASLLLGFPMFFDAGLVVMLPIIFAVAARIGGPILLYAIPTVAAFSVMHVFVPPHPGPVAASTFFDTNLGLLIVFGLIVAVPTFYVSGLLWGKYCAKKFPFTSVANAVFNSDDSDIKSLPKTGTVITILLLPMLLIFLNTGVDFATKSGAITGDETWAQAFTFLGKSGIALLISVLVALPVLGTSRGVKGSALEKLVDSALGPIASVVFITGAGGMYGGVLRASGIGDAIADLMQGLGIPVILAVYLVAVIMRVAQGSATVALTTTAGLMAPAVLAGGYSEIQIVAITLACAAGSVCCSLVNDSGFWLVGRLFGMDVKTTLKTWTLQQTIESVAAFLITLLIFVLF